MAATISGSFKAYIEGLGLGVAVYRDVAPLDAVLPYVVVTESVSIVPVRLGDNGRDDAVVETVQLDLYEQWRDANHQLIESYTRARQLEQALRSPSLNDLPMRVHGVAGLSRTRQLDREGGLVRNIITVDVRRDQ